MDYSLIIPVYNEERSIKELLNDLKFLSNSIEIIIINDGSNDDTNFQTLRNKNTVLLNHKYNLALITFFDRLYICNKV